jgi:hypothetical protein
VCENFQPQFCVTQNCSDINECYPSQCRILPTLEASDFVNIVFTAQTFDVVQGVLSELRTDGDFFLSTCTSAVNDSFTDTQPTPPAGEGRYYLLGTVEGVSCTDHGDSTFVPDPRDDLDASCP